VIIDKAQVERDPHTLFLASGVDSTQHLCGAYPAQFQASHTNRGIRHAIVHIERPIRARIDGGWKGLEYSAHDEPRAIMTSIVSSGAAAQKGAMCGRQKSKKRQ
jgi:hypothetical protein